MDYGSQSKRALEQLKILGWDIITNEYVLCPYCKDNIDRDVAFWENILEQAEDQVELIKCNIKATKFYSMRFTKCRRSSSTNRRRIKLCKG